MSAYKRYGEWAGNPKGIKYNPLKCAEEVYPKGIYHSAQCSKKKGYGPGGLYCKQHAKKHYELKNSEKDFKEGCIITEWSVPKVLMEEKEGEVK